MGEYAEESSRHYHYVKSRDFDDNAPCGSIQWKGTDVCIDLRCTCGRHSHIDAEFLYLFECACGKKYALGSVVKLIELDDEQIEICKKHQHNFVREE